MHNELLHIGPLTVYGYGFMIAMGVLAAWFVAEQRARKLKLACEHNFLSGSVLRHWWIYICEDFVLDHQLEGISAESKADHRIRWICGIWRNHRRNSGGLAVLQDKEVEISGVF